MDEGLRNLWLSSLLTEANVLLPEFLTHVWRLCGGELNDLPHLNPQDDNIMNFLIKFRISFPSQNPSQGKIHCHCQGKERKRLEAVEKVLKSLKWFFSQLIQNPSKDWKILMADEKGPGLSIIV